MQCCCKSFAEDGYRSFLLYISTKKRCIRKELNVFTNKLCIGFLDVDVDRNSNALDYLLID